MGAGLRQLQAFLKEADRSCSWGGLELVQLEGDAEPVWVCKECLLNPGGGGA